MAYKMKTRDWKTRHETTGLENTFIEEGQLLRLSTWVLLKPKTGKPGI